MGLLEALLGANNPAAQWANQNSNFLGAIGAGLGQGQNIQSGLSAGLAAVPQAKALDRENAEKLKAEAKVAAQTNATKAWLEQNYPDLAQAVDAGLSVSDAWQEAFKRQSAKTAAPDYPAEYDLYKLSQTDPGFAEYLKGQGDAPAAPSGYQWSDNGGLEFIPGGPADPSMKRAGAPLDPTTKKELFEAEDAAKAGDYVLSALDEALALNDKAYDGPTADIRGDATSLWGDESGVATARLKNVTTELALSQLKTIFGSMPTEGERKILLELQGSVNQAKPVRAAILKRAKELAERRIADNRAKADALRSGAYFEEGYGAPTGNQTSTGVSWSIEP